MSCRGVDCGSLWRRWMLAVLAAVLLTPTAALANSPLVIVPSSLARLGWRASGASRPSARSALAFRLPHTVTAAIGRADTETSAAVRNGERLTSDAFVLPSASSAHRVLLAWRHATHASALKVGLDGALAQRGSGRGTLFSVAFREGARVGLLQVLAAPGATGGSSFVTQFAPLADSLLKAGLSSTAWGKLFEQVRPNGSVSKQTALQAVALAYGSLPGVHPPTGARSAIPSGTLAELWILPYLPQLSAGLRSEVLKRLGFSAGAVAHAASYGDPGFKPSAALTATANKWRDAVAAHLGPLSLKIVAGVSTSVVSANDAAPVDAGGAFSVSGPFCRIRITATTASGSAAYLADTVAHEVFHCFEFQINHDFPTMKAWIIEGLAEWAGLAVTGTTYKTDGSSIRNYLNNPGTPLFARSYDAVGFWGHVQDEYGNLWSRVKSILNPGTNEAAFAAAGGNEDQFLSTWASTQVRSATGGADWQMDSPFVPPNSTELPVSTLFDNSDSLIDVVSPYALGHVRVAVGPLVHITVTGHGRLSVEHNYTDLGDGWFCTEAGGCQCPAGSQGQVPANQPLEPGAELALTGDPSGGATADIEAHTLEEFCSGLIINQEEPGGSPQVIGHISKPGTCTIDSSGALKVTLTGDGPTLEITVPNFRTLPRRSDGATIFDFVAPRDGGPDAALAGTGWSTGDFFSTDPGVQIPQGTGGLHRDGQDGFIAAIMFENGNPASRLASGTFSCAKAVK
jgi:hypothetical protein